MMNQIKEANIEMILLLFHYQIEKFGEEYDDE